MVRRLLVALALTPAILFASLYVAPAQQAAAVAQDCTKSFLGLPAWYKYLESTPWPECDINGPRETSDPSSPFNWPKAAGFVGIAVFEALLRIAALVAVVYVVYGGFRYITSQGEPEGAKSARETILNALIGVVIAIAAASIVSFIMQRLTAPETPPAGDSTGYFEVEYRS